MRTLRIAPAAAAVGSAFFLFFASAQAANDEKSPPQSTEASTPVDKADEIVCKKIEMPGSRVSRHKECKTRAEWGEVEEKESPKED